MGRSPCCSKEGLNRGAWTPLEDKILFDYITSHGEGKWRSLPKSAGLKRCGKSCRLRWLNYLRPDIKRGNITPDEEELIIRLHKLLGNRWSLIAGRLPGRTDNEIKNYWNTNIGRRLQATESTSNESIAKKNPSPTAKQQKQDHLQLQLQREGSSVVRTKASRCSEVFINSDLQQQQIGIMAQHKTIEATISENSANDDFMMMNFSVDDIDYLTNFLDNDFFMPPPPQAQAQTPVPAPWIDNDVTNAQICIKENSNINERIDANVSSRNPCGLWFGSRHGHGHEVHDEFHGVSMNMMSIFDTCTTLDWIQDQPSN